MKRMILNKAQQKEWDRIIAYFKECTEHISDSGERAYASVKIMSHLSVFAERLVGHLNKNQKWEEV